MIHQFYIKRTEYFLQSVGRKNIIIWWCGITIRVIMYKCNGSCSVSECYLCNSTNIKIGRIYCAAACLFIVYYLRWCIKTKLMNFFFYFTCIKAGEIGFQLFIILELPPVIIAAHLIFSEYFFSVENSFNWFICVYLLMCDFVGIASWYREK